VIPNFIIQYFENILHLTEINNNDADNNNNSTLSVSICCLGFDTVIERAPVLYKLLFLQYQKHLHLWNVATPRATPKRRPVCSFFCFYFIFLFCPSGE